MRVVHVCSAFTLNLPEHYMKQLHETIKTYSISENKQAFWEKMGYPVIFIDCL